LRELPPGSWEAIAYEDAIGRIIESDDRSKNGNPLYEIAEIERDYIGRYGFN
jgi:hypothetical protein